MFQKKFLLAITLLAYSLFAHAGFDAEPNNTIATATPLKLNEIFTGNMDFLPDTDNYKLELTAPTEIKFYFKILDTMKHQRVFKILDHTGAVIYSAVVNATYVDHVFGVNLVAGKFYVQISSGSRYTGSSSRAPYELSALSPLSVVPRLITIPSVIDTTSLLDVNANGYEDFAILRILSDARTVVDVVDGYTKEAIKRIVYTTDSRVSQPISITGFNDLDKNGTPDIGVFFKNATSPFNVHVVREAATGRIVRLFEEKTAQ